MRIKISKLVPLLSAAVLLSITALGLGIAASEFNYWPARFCADAIEAALRFKSTGIFTLKKDRVYPSRESGKSEPIEILQPASIASGYRAIMAWDQNQRRYSIKLIDSSGRQLHDWPVDLDALDSSNSMSAAARPDGMAILANGSVIVNFRLGNIMTRLDACGSAVWIKSGNFHGSIEQDDNGSFWTWQGKETTHADYQYLLNFNAQDGKTIRSLGLVEDIIEKNDARLIFSIPEHYEYRKVGRREAEYFSRAETFVPTKIIPLPASWADRFNEFSAGDLLISLLHTRMIAIVDKTDGRIKWWMNAPWMFQSDVNLSPDGRILVYNSYFSVKILSSLLAVEPLTKKVEEISLGDNYFESAFSRMRLAGNGNLLLILPQMGKLVEVDKLGHTVFSYTNIAGDKAIGHLPNAQWLPENYFTEMPKCQSK